MQSRAANRNAAIGVLIAILPLQLLIVLLRGALSRGRDSFFVATAVACLVTIACEIYCDASFGEITVKNACHDHRWNGSRPDPRLPSEVAGLTAYADRLATVVHSLDAPGIWIRTHR